MYPISFARLVNTDFVQVEQFLTVKSNHRFAFVLCFTGLAVRKQTLVGEV